ncbi:uncharacterized protein LOC129590574 [Paramacrobiotus metropolitanus]|uniref:uncharacterized protein LOC129590574 n=1 Tax=Paramacrobiotus metropolitanus TaxID=2943436 RepID=UPI00244655CC|nr:uncharacterized protein LOC129590574 [Paramacrobiotus metropolitanus]
MSWINAFMYIQFLSNVTFCTYMMAMEYAVNRSLETHRLLGLTESVYFLALYAVTFIYITEQGFRITMQQGNDEVFKHYGAEYRLHPVGFSMAGILVTRETVIMASGAITSYVLLFSELADNEKSVNSEKITRSQLEQLWLNISTRCNSAC